jgi:hypothetical protein
MDGIKDLLKLQMVTGGNGAATGSGSILNLVFLTIVEEFFKFLPAILAYIKAIFRKRAQTAFQKIVTDQHVSIIVEHKVSGSSPSDELSEGILKAVTNATGVTDLRYAVGRYLVDFKHPFTVSPGIECQLLGMNFDTSKNTLDISLKLFSVTKTMPELRAFVEQCHAAYKAEQRNKLGDKLYFFDQVVSKTGNSFKYNADGKHGVVHPPRLTFSKHLFSTTRTFDNIFFEQRDAVKKRVDFFLKRRDWYEQKGVPYTLGLLLHGVPGAGEFDRYMHCCQTTVSSYCVLCAHASNPTV